MKMEALLLPDYGADPVVTTVELTPPGPGEILVRVVVSGVCGSDVHAVNGTLPLPVPLVLGHEGAGLVEEVGEGVTRVAPGDRVVLHWIPSCGECFWCRHDQPELCEAANHGAVHGALPSRSSHLSWQGDEAYAFSMTGTLARYAVVPESGLTPIPDDIPWDEAALLGCAVLTGTGAAFRSPVSAGDAVLVIGLGGVGQSIVQGARIAGATRIIAVDPVPFKRATALTLGATMVVDPEVTDPLDAVLALTDDRGVDVAFEAVGRPDLIALAFNAVRKGGTAVAVGVPAPNEEVTVNAFAFPSQEKTLTGSWYGGAHPALDVPRLLNLWRRGELRLKPLLTRSYDLADAAQAVRDLADGVLVRGAVWLSDPP